MNYAQTGSSLRLNRFFSAMGLAAERREEANVPAIRIHGNKGTPVLAFDLKDILAALGPNGLAAYWTVGDVDAHGKPFDTEFDATGEGAVALEKLAVSRERIDGSRLMKIAKSVRQVIWGEFKGYDDKLADTPRLVVIAFDSSWWEIQSADEALLDRVATVFEGVERV